jgi:broad specificity phosphatase PhoE
MRGSTHDSGRRLRLVVAFRYVTHPNVHIDPKIPVPHWSLSDHGRERAEAMLDQPWAKSVRRIIASAETKALETAWILAEPIGVDVEIRHATGEIDRSATGFVTPDVHEELANQLFAEPTSSASGWERAVDAQQRIVDAFADVLDDEADDLVIVGHGGVGTLLYCHLSGLPIDRRYDQTGPGGCYFTVDHRRVLHAWRRIEDIESA